MTRGESIDWILDAADGWEKAGTALSLLEWTEPRNEPAIKAAEARLLEHTKLLRLTIQKHREENPHDA